VPFHRGVIEANGPTPSGIQPTLTDSKPTARPPWRQAVPVAIASSAVFLGLYSLCNWLASLRSGIGTWQYAWERRIPFVPWMMLPYLSINVFFVTAFFLCTSRQELWTHFKRIVAANLIAAVCFLLFPLRMAAHRPDHFDGPLGPFVRFFYRFDRPYNLVPSLHIAQGLLVWIIFSRHTRPPIRWLVHGWFLLIGVSTLFTWQHAVPDLVAGWMLGMLCWWLFPDTHVSTELPGQLRPECSIPSPRNYPVAWRWTAGAIILVAFGFLLRPWGWLLAWPAFGAAMVAAAYFRLGPGVFRKTDGRLPIATRWVFFPVLVATRLARFYLNRPSDQWVRVLPEVVIGRQLSGRAARQLIEQEKITAVLDLTAECGECAALRRPPYLNIPLLDLTVPSANQFRAAVAFVREHGRRGTVYVHCALGYSRAAAVVAAYLIAERHADDVNAALHRIRQLRPQIVIRQNSICALEAYQQLLSGDDSQSLQLTVQLARQAQPGAS